MGKFDWGDWFYALVYAFIGAGASSLNTALGAMVAAPTEFNIANPRKLLTLVACSFILPGAVAFFAKLSQRPLPSIKVTTETTTMQTDPPAIVKQTITETKAAPPQTGELKP